MKSKILTGLFFLFIIIVISTQVKAESFSSNKSSVTVGDSFTITMAGINGKVEVSTNDKISLSSKGTMFVEGSMTITGTAKSAGIGTVTVKLIDVTTTGADPKELTGTRNVNITIKEKEVEQPTTTAPDKSTTPTTTTKKTETTKKDTQKKETKVVTQTEEKEEATPEWGISAVKLTGIKENEERIDIELDKQFTIKTYEYSCNVASDVKKIEVQKEAYEYNDFVTISGLEEELKEGENIITLKLSKEGQEELLYTIKVNKEIQEKIENTNTENINSEVIEEEVTKSFTVSMPLWCFIILELLIIVITAVITFFIIKNMKNRI